MDIRYLFLIIFVFIMEVLFLSKELNFKDNILVVDKINVEFINSKTYDINNKNIKSILICDKIQQLKDKKLFFKPIVTLYDINITKTIFANKAILEDKTNQIKVKDSVKIIYQDKQLSTDYLLYDLKNSTILDSSIFQLKSDDILAKGEHLYFDTKHSIIKAKNINYKFFMKE